MTDEATWYSAVEKQRDLYRRMAGFGDEEAK